MIRTKRLLLLIILLTSFSFESIFAEQTKMSFLLSTKEQTICLKTGQSFKFISKIINLSNAPVTIVKREGWPRIFDENFNLLKWWADYDEVLIDMVPKKEDYITLQPNDQLVLDEFSFQLCYGQINVNRNEYTGYYLKTLNCYIPMWETQKINIQMDYQVYHPDIEYAEKLGITNMFKGLIRSNVIEVEIAS